MKRPLILIGGGEHARVLLDAARADGDRSFAGFIDPSPPGLAAAGTGLPWLGGDDEGLKLARTGQYEFVLAMGAVGPQPLRVRLTMHYEAAGAGFATIVHPRAAIAPSATVGAGSVVLAGAIVNPGAELGRHCIVNTGAIVEHDVLIGDFAVLAPGAIVGGGAQIGPETFIGLGSRVRDHVRVGRGVLLAMGAVLVSDAPDGVLMMGVPARVQKESRVAGA